MTGVWLISMLLISSLSALPGPVRALTIEGKSIDGMFAGINADGAILIEHVGKTRPLVASGLMSLRWVNARPTTRPHAELPAVVYLADGGRLYARITGSSSKQIELETTATGNLTIPMARLAAIRFSNRDHPAAREAFEKALAKRDPSRDLLLVVRDDRVTALRGVVESLGADGGSFKWRNRSVPIDPHKTYGLVLAAGVHREPSPPVLCVVRDGSVWGGRIVGGNGDEIKLELTGGASITFPAAELIEIRFRSDRVLFLSDLKPAEYVFEPFAATRWPYRVNRSVANRPLRIGKQTFDHGIGMHAKATLVYELPEGFTHLAAVIGIDEAVGSLGNAIFRVVADDKVVFDSGPVAGNDEPRSILVPIAGVIRLKLVVDFGDDLDIGDQANWANARLIK